MSRKNGNHSNARGPRNLTRQETDLWQQITETVTPLNLTTQTTAPEVEPYDQAAFDAFKQTRPASQKEPAFRPAPQPKKLAPQPSNQPPPITGLDRRTSQKLTRGKVEIDARIDLHGHSQAEAHVALRGFLHHAHASGNRLVLVITGKGDAPYSRHTLHGRGAYHMPERRAVLREAVPRWFAEPEFRTLVAGYQPAHPRHGGGGAYYVRLRRNKPQGRA